jgi:hypothetical protein
MQHRFVPKERSRITHGSSIESDKRRTGDIRFIRVRYFGIHDHIKEGLIELVEVPTEKMASDHFTKPV